LVPVFNIIGESSTSLAGTNDERSLSTDRHESRAWMSAGRGGNDRL